MKGQNRGNKLRCSAKNVTGRSRFGVIRAWLAGISAIESWLAGCVSFDLNRRQNVIDFAKICNAGNIRAIQIRFVVI